MADIVKHLKEAIAEGRIRDADPDVLAHAMVGVAGHVTATFIYERGEPADEVADAAVAFCLQGMLGGAGSPTEPGAAHSADQPSSGGPS